jgi:hypothetical protein
MIDLMGLNGTNGKNDDSFVPCPSCVELRYILDIVNDFKVSEVSSTYDIIRLMASELLMYRAKNNYETELKKQFISGISKKINEMEQ